jgi:dethiobiotin synthetase
MSVLVVSGTGTGVGKTVVTAALAALARARNADVAVVKPAQTGVGPDEPGDLAEVRRLTGVDDLHELARFPDPLSPAAAARLARRPPLVLRDAVRAIGNLAATRRLVLVEGAGGLLVRFDDDGATIADLARELAAPVLVVTRPGLGTLNETALTLEALAHRGLSLAGVVLGSWPRQPDLAARSNVRDLETLAARPLSGALPEGAATLEPAEFLAAAAAGLAPAFGGRFDATDFRRAHDPLSRADGTGRRIEGSDARG